MRESQWGHRRFVAGSAAPMGVGNKPVLQVVNSNARRKSVPVHELRIESD